MEEQADFDCWEPTLEDIIVGNGHSICASKPPRHGEGTHQMDVSPVDAERIKFINSHSRDVLVAQQQKRIEAEEARIRNSTEALRIVGRPHREQICPGCRKKFTAYRKRCGNRWPTYCSVCAHRSHSHQLRRNHEVQT